MPKAFATVVAAAKAAVLDSFGPERLHSGYLYGSIPRGTAVPGVSDLDMLLALRHEPTDADRKAAATLETMLDTSFTQINGAGIGLASTATLLSDLERYDLGWFVACLCTPLIGEDLAAQLPRYRPTSLLARETNGDVGDLLPRWGGWTSALDESAAVFGRYYPEGRKQMELAAEAARQTTADRAVLGMLIDDLGPWLAAEYLATHGRKTPRP